MYLKWLIWTLPKIFLFAVYGALEFITPTTFGEQEGFSKNTAAFIDKNRFWIFLFSGIIYAIVEFTYIYIPLSPTKQAAGFRQQIMETMLEELFENDKNNVRITIFKDAGFWRKCRICLSRYFKKEPFKWSSFIYVWERLGTEHPNSKTYFYFNPETIKDCEGIAGRVRQSKAELFVEDLPNIEPIDLKKLRFLDKNSTEVKTIKSYMSKGYVDDARTLIRLNRHSRHIYGAVLTDKLGDFKGVLVIDSFNSYSPFDWETRQNIGYYLKLIGQTM